MSAYAAHASWGKEYKKEYKMGGQTIENTLS